MTIVFGEHYCRRRQLQRLADSRRITLRREANTKDGALDERIRGTRHPQARSLCTGDSAVDFLERIGLYTRWFYLVRAYADWVTEAENRGLTVGRVVILDQTAQLELPETELRRRMSENVQVMRKAVQTGLTAERRSLSGLSGGDARKVYARWQKGQSLVGDRISGAIVRALAVSEVNASMGKIVAAPTAGSCGVLPAVLFTVEEAWSVPEDVLLTAMFTAAGIGMVLADRASISGAEGGCQAEIGSAAAMAAAAAVEMSGGSPAQTAHAGAIALKSLLGLVCDPVGGLVEVPCVKRNAIAATIALSAAEMALAGVESAIPVDEVIDTMAAIGKQMPCALRETAQGGLAITPTGQRIRTSLI